MITPMEIQQKAFKSGIGYDKRDVDTFIVEIVQSYEELYNNNIELNDKVNMLNEGIQHYKAIEASLQKALVIAEKTSEETIKTAEEKAKYIEEDALKDIQSKVDKANAEFEKVQRQTMELISEYNGFKGQFMQLLQGQIGLLNSPNYEVANSIIGDIKHEAITDNSVAAESSFVDNKNNYASATNNADIYASDSNTNFTYENNNTVSNDEFVNSTAESKNETFIQNNSFETAASSKVEVQNNNEVPTDNTLSSDTVAKPFSTNFSGEAYVPLDDGLSLDGSLKDNSGSLRSSLNFDDEREHFVDPFNLSNSTETNPFADTFVNFNENSSDTPRKVEMKKPTSPVQTSNDFFKNSDDDNSFFDFLENSDFENILSDEISSNVEPLKNEDVFKADSINNQSNINFNSFENENNINVDAIENENNINVDAIENDNNINTSSTEYNSRFSNTTDFKVNDSQNIIHGFAFNDSSNIAKQTESNSINVEDDNTTKLNGFTFSTEEIREKDSFASSYVAPEVKPESSFTSSYVAPEVKPESSFNASQYMSEAAANASSIQNNATEKAFESSSNNSNDIYDIDEPMVGEIEDRPLKHTLISEYDNEDAGFDFI